MADKHGVSHLISSSVPLSSLPPLSGASRPFSVRGRTNETRASVRYTVPHLLEACGCHGSERHETEARTVVAVRVPLALAASLYGALVGYGIVFDGPTHLEWSRLCTVQAFAGGLPTGDGGFHLRLEIAFRKPVGGGDVQAGQA